jgi:hypothetical protein
MEDDKPTLRDVIPLQVASRISPSTALVAHVEGSADEKRTIKLPTKKPKAAIRKTRAKKVATKQTVPSVKLDELV